MEYSKLTKDELEHFQKYLKYKIDKRCKLIIDNYSYLFSKVTEGIEVENELNSR